MFEEAPFCLSKTLGPRWRYRSFNLLRLRVFLRCRSWRQRTPKKPFKVSNCASISCRLCRPKILLIRAWFQYCRSVIFGEVFLLLISLVSHPIFHLNSVTLASFRLMLSILGHRSPPSLTRERLTTLSTTTAPAYTRQLSFQSVSVLPLQSSHSWAIRLSTTLSSALSTRIPWHEGLSLAENLPSTTASTSLIRSGTYHRARQVLGMKFLHQR